MQSLAAYLFEATMAEPTARLTEIDGLIDRWLVKKGAAEPLTSDGAFTSRSGDGTGQYSRMSVVSDVGELREVELIETAHTGAMFTTLLQVVATADRVVVHASLSAAPGESRVAPVGLYPRCPWVIRTIVETFPDWKFAGQEVPLARPFDATTDDAATKLSEALRSKSRKLPIVVVSDDPDEGVWQDLGSKVAESLVGLADVAVVSPESSWVLTDELGPRDSCYLGAVRLYWPGTRPDGSLSGVTWRAARLSAFGGDDTGRARFLALLRKEVMSVAALTMMAPTLIRHIRTSAEKARVQTLEAGARDRELDSIVDENARLSEELTDARRTIESLQWKLMAASYAQRETPAANDEDGEEPGEGDAEALAPEPGEVRHYKKIGSGGGVDSLVRTKACNHKEGNWKPAFKGDKAEKGLLKLEGRNDWKSLYHCSSCTGGGRWRVHW